ncbi:MAG TPA: 50S ribosomal protein L4 [Planctomycetota bacterium]|nr:50S ribosomal protein L4 [Planctomycetota bacterium]HRR81410.1 50S ribosomal protein L4 [Planctomycetota bacterium]HRT94751.1 50S ribosomal protein L4 [Planctomycetota bacterium]
MIELLIRNREGQVVGRMEIDEADFGGTVRPKLLRDVVRMYEAAQRVGTHSTLRRGEVKGSGTKPWRQKGTGRARAGCKRSPLWRGGGIVFGPHPREYRFAMPRKAVLGATRSAYLAKFQDGETVVVDALEAAQPRTKEMAAALSNLGVARGCLIAIEKHDVNLWKSARNLPGVFMKAVAEVNAYDLLRHRQLVITQRALESLVARMRQARRPASEQPVAGAVPAVGVQD